MEGWVGGGWWVVRGCFWGGWVVTGWTDGWLAGLQDGCLAALVDWYLWRAMFLWSIVANSFFYLHPNCCVALYQVLYQICRLSASVSGVVWVACSRHDGLATVGIAELKVVAPLVQQLLFLDALLS